MILHVSVLLKIYITREQALPMLENIAYCRGLMALTLTSLSRGGWGLDRGYLLLHGDKVNKVLSERRPYLVTSQKSGSLRS